MLRLNCEKKVVTFRDINRDKMLTINSLNYENKVIQLLEKKSR